MKGESSRTAGSLCSGSGASSSGDHQPSGVSLTAEQEQLLRDWTSSVWSKQLS